MINHHISRKRKFLISVFAAVEVVAISMIALCKLLLPLPQPHENLKRYVCFKISNRTIRLEGASVQLSVQTKLLRAFFLGFKTLQGQWFCKISG